MLCRLLALVCFVHFGGYSIGEEHGQCSNADSNKNIWKESCTTQPDTDDIGTVLIEDIYTSVRKAAHDLDNPSHYPAHYSPHEGEEFDFIIVGSGSAGAVIANRLSEHAGWNILVLEAGGNPTKTTEIPGIYGALQLTKVDWQYQTEPKEDNCLGMVNNSCNWPRGKVLGGSSTINANLYVRGNQKDFDSWAAAGNTGWDFDSVLQYFKKSEDIKASEVRNLLNYQKYHGEEGYLSVDTWRNYGIQDVVDMYSKGMEELGYKVNMDLNGESQTGFVKLQGTTVGGKRCSTAKAFLKPIKNRKNLKIAMNSLATEVLVDKVTKSAVGVKFLNDQGKLVQVKAKNEVIVSAGAINSPQLLMLSGIGPKQHLSDMGIDLIQDLPVGENLQDHMLMVGLVYSFNYTRPTKPLTEYMYDFLKTNTSKFSGLGMLSYSPFINTLDSSVSYPDIQIHHFDFDPNDIISLGSTMRAFGIKDEIALEYYKVNSNRYINFMMPTLLNPVSRGSIFLKSKDPRIKPTIIAGYFKDNQEDLETFLRSIEFISKLASTEAMKKLDTKFHEIQAPACRKYPIASRDFRICSLKHLTTTTYHPTSTCKMGPASDPTSVVDPTLRVIGVKRLRVADASVMPTIVSGNTNAATIMIGEKASDLIKVWLLLHNHC